MPKTVESHEVDFSQIGLIAAICQELHLQTRRAFRGRDLATLPRQVNAIITASNSILDELKRPYRPSTPGCGFTAWVLSDDVGLSSEFTARYIMGDRQMENYTPKDSADFGRCLKMLEACPGLKACMDRMKLASDEWRRLIEDWTELERLYATNSEGCSKRISALLAPAGQEP